MTKILVNSQGKALLTGNGKPLTKVSGGGGHTGTVDTVGLTALGWDTDDIQWLQNHVWWDAEDDAEWAVTEANKAFGPTGATPLTWSNYTAQKTNADLRYFPKLTTPSGTSMQSTLSGFYATVAIPTHGWDMSAITTFQSCFTGDVLLRSVGDISQWVTAATTSVAYMFNNCLSLPSLDISRWVFTKITTMVQIFNCCNSLKDVSLPATINAPLLTNISGAFNTSGIEELTINLSAPSLTDASSLCANCFRLRKLKLSISSTVLSNFTSLTYPDYGVEEIDYTGIDTTSCTSLGTSHFNSPFGVVWPATTIKLGSNFFKGSFTTLYANQCYSWTRDSIYESLYTNQTGRDSTSPAVTINLAGTAYDRLSASDLSDIATKKFTITRV